MPCPRRPAAAPLPLALLLLLATLIVLLSATVADAFVVAPALPAARRRAAPTVSMTAEEGTPTPITEVLAAAPPAPEAPAPTTTKTGPCKKYPKCDGAYRNKGCDGAGKIQGGIATFPLLGWWPIKVRNPTRFPSAHERNRTCRRARHMHTYAGPSCWSTNSWLTFPPLSLSPTPTP